MPELTATEHAKMALYASWNAMENATRDAMVQGVTSGLAKAHRAMHAVQQRGGTLAEAMAEVRGLLDDEPF